MLYRVTLAGPPPPSAPMTAYRSASAVLRLGGFAAAAAAAVAVAFAVVIGIVGLSAASAPSPPT